MLQFLIGDQGSPGPDRILGSRILIVRVVAAVIRNRGRILITRRPQNVHLGGLWEFPGGKVEPGESLPEALAREIEEELGIHVNVTRRVASIEHCYPGRSVRLYFFDCEIISGEAKPLQALELRWVLPAELDQFRFPEGDLGMIALLKQEP